MAEKVGEYLGIDIKKRIPVGVDSDSKLGEECPFRSTPCVKLRKGQAPVCSVRSPKDDSLWIVCEHRLCSSTPKDAPLTAYQKDVLEMIADSIAPTWRKFARVAVQREGNVRRRPGRNSPDDSYADYFMVFLEKDSDRLHPKFKPVILEMQGGGETSNTKAMSNHVKAWEKNPGLRLAESMPISSIETNAWRRQQEQFLIKGSVATRSNGKLVFVVGARLFDKLMTNLTSPPTRINVEGGWTLAVLGVVESPEGVGTSESIRIGIDPSRSLFTDYGAFARSLTDQGQYDPELFIGKYVTLDGRSVHLLESD